MNLVLSYEDIVNKFNSDLINKLRKHGSEVNYLNLWVPDEDFLRSFESLSESIKASNVNTFTLNVKKKFISESTLLDFKNKFPDIKIEKNENFFLIYVKDLSVFELKKKIIDKVLDKKQIKIDYSYGSLNLQKSNNKVREFFLKLRDLGSVVQKLASIKCIFLVNLSLLDLHSLSILSRNH